jgi:Zn-finger protein
MAFKQVKDGEWVKPKMTGYVHECCNCGAMHRMDFRVESDGENIEMRGTRLTDKEAADVRAKHLAELIADMEAVTAAGPIAGDPNYGLEDE